MHAAAAPRLCGRPVVLQPPSFSWGATSTAARTLHPFSTRKVAIALAYCACRTVRVNGAVSRVLIDDEASHADFKHVLRRAASLSGVRMRSGAAHSVRIKARSVCMHGRLGVRTHARLACRLLWGATCRSKSSGHPRKRQLRPV